LLLTNIKRAGEDALLTGPICLGGPLLGVVGILEERGHSN